MNKKIISKDTLITIDGKNFKCTCGCNVFTHYEDDIFICHCCGKEFKGE